MLTVANVLSIHNVYLQQCASAVDLALRASGRTLDCADACNCAKYGLSSWQTHMTDFTLSSRPFGCIITKGAMDLTPGEKWSAPRGRSWAGTVCCSIARGLEYRRATKDQIFNFANTSSWSEAGIRDGDLETGF